ncbi:MAG TPA: hypothetical protein VHB79_34750 [Polyangiaceae bacterium]|nr:hypothetical protein [Polyangiaceae bacterium]
MKRFGLPLASVASVALLSAGVARAEDDNVNRPVHATRRSDFTAGLSVGAAFGRASGYPNEVQKIDDTAYRQNTKLGAGPDQFLWLGVAFNDYLTFGLGFGGVSLTGNDRTGKATIYGFHIDAYPLFDLNKNLQDLGVFANIGTGPLTITGGGREDAKGGAMSYLEGGLVYERLRLWRFGIGPTLSVSHMWSETAKLTATQAGLRVAIYTGP